MKKKPAISVLMIEDMQLAQIVAIKIFEELNCNIHVVTTAAKALEQILMFHYDIIFIDIQLPDINGLTLANTMRNLERRGTHIPLIAVTANNKQELEPKSLSAGFDAFMLKPLTKDSVQEILHKYVKKKIKTKS